MIMFASGSSPASRAFCARLALLAIRLVEVLHALELRGGADLGLELRRELALRADEQDDVLLALLEVAQVGQAVIEGAQRDVVHAARGLLAVASDERDGVALVDEVDGGLDGSRLEAELSGERGDDVHEAVPFWFEIRARARVTRARAAPVDHPCKVH